MHGLHYLADYLVLIWHMSIVILLLSSKLVPSVD